MAEIRRRGRFLRPAILVPFLVLTACSSFEETHASLEVTIPEAPLDLTHSGFCAIDADCDTGTFCFFERCVAMCATNEDCGSDSHCSVDGKCVSSLTSTRSAPRKTAEPFARITDADIVEWPPSTVMVDAEQDTARVVMRTRVPTQQPVYYILEYVADGLYTDVQALAPSDTFVIDIPTERAGLSSDEARPELVVIHSSLGEASVQLLPERGTSGVYDGEVLMHALHGSVPIELAIRLEPSHATLVDADQRFLRLRNDTMNLYAPHGNAPSWVESPLVWDEASGSWYAAFSDMFHFPSSSLFASDYPVQRALRVEITHAEAGRIEGAIRDQWVGLFHGQSPTGEVISGSLVITGDLKAARVAGLSADPLPVETADPVSIHVPSRGRQEPTECSSTVYTQLRDYAGRTTDACSLLPSVDTWLQASDTYQSTCAIALADAALEQAKTSQQLLQFLDEQQENPGGESFKTYLERCAVQDGVCQDDPAIHCARELTTYAYQARNASATTQATLLTLLQKLTHEKHLGRQLAAYHVDASSRMAWLQRTIAPPFLAMELRRLNHDLMERWEADVLDAHLHILREEMSFDDMNILARTPSDAEGIAIRSAMLLERSQTWQGSIEAVELAIRRWSDLLDRDTDRSRAADEMRAYGLDFYLSANMLGHLNILADQTALNALFGPALRRFFVALHHLELPFHQRLFERDAHVVVSTSVDPSKNNNSLLRDRETVARRRIRDAQRSIDLVISDATNREINQRTLTDNFYRQLLELEAQLVELCGLPDGCVAADIGRRPECTVQVAHGACGLGSSSGAATHNTLNASAAASEAGQALLRAQQAFNQQAIAENDMTVLRAKIAAELAALDAFERQLAKRDQDRRSVAAQVQRQIDEALTLGGGRVESALSQLRDAQTRRQQAYDKQFEQVAQWNLLEFQHASAQQRSLYIDLGITSAKEAMMFGTVVAARVKETQLSALPTVVGPGAVDPSGAARLAINASIGGVILAAEAGKLASSISLATEKMKRESRELMHGLELRRLESLHDLDVAWNESELQRIADELRALDLVTDHEIRIREAMIDSLRETLAIDLAHEKELVELRDRRDRAWSLGLDTTNRAFDIEAADLQIQRAILHYAAIVQKAQLIDARAKALALQVSSLENILGSPSVIFSFTNRLLLAEDQLNRARESVFDWLVALEYYAVRPFTDQRVALLLARNPSQLEAISNHLLDIERTCGGAVNTSVVDVSLREDIMQHTFSSLAADGTVWSAAQRFRETLKRANIAANQQIRFGADRRIRDVLRGDTTLGMTVPIRLDDFANLPLVCNAKIQDVSVQLVGKGIPDHARPVVSILYDGTSALRSCQPSISAIRAALGPGTTRFAPVTEFQTAGRAIHPVARVNHYGPPDTANKGFEGLPFASTYAVLIDTSLPENTHIPWEAVEDIRLRFTYTYQDVFPVGQCQ